ncbi:hypothetical protein ACIO8F_24700 [Streptomyces sp. NPDC087228]|uniref:hypothetical protein n=1 Tax=unclassified Streptomyces TaxID=2593676 RepID=UPI0033DDA1C1
MTRPPSLVRGRGKGVELSRTATGKLTFLVGCRRFSLSAHFERLNNIRDTYRRRKALLLLRLKMGVPLQLMASARKCQDHY